MSKLPDILKNGNKKLKNMLVYSHSPIKGCLDCKSCAKTCYAVKSYRQYPSVKNAWDRNLDMVRNNLSAFITKITMELLKTKKRVVRIHASGDFISQAYINAWAEIAKGFPEIKFYTYTKSLDRWDYTELLALSNVNIIDSFIDGELNYGNEEHIKHLVEDKKAFLCPATDKTKAKEVKCGENCTYCVSKDRVCFLQH